MSKNKILSHLSETRIGFLMVVLVFVIFFLKLSFLGAVSQKMADFNFKVRGPMPGNRDVVVVAIDQRSEDKFGRWPWTRSVIAGLITRINKYNPRVMGIDIVFSYPEARPDRDLAGRLLAVTPENHPLRGILQQAEKNADVDGILAAAIHGSGRVVPGYFFLTSEEDSSRLKLDNEADYKIIKHSRFPAVKFPPGGFKGKLRINEAVGVKPNIKQITDAAVYTGYFNMYPDDDGMMRNMTNVIGFNGKYFPSLSLQLLRGWYGDEQMKMEVEEYGVKGFHVGPKFIPSDEHGRTPINFYGDEKMIPTVSAADLAEDGLADEKLEPMFRDKIVIFGATAVGIYDLRSTPFGVMPGVYLHAFFIQSVLDDIVLNKAGWFIIFNAASILALGLLLTLAMKRLNVAGGGALALALIIGYLWFQRYMFETRHTVLEVLYPIMAVFAVYGGIAFYKYLVEASERQYVKKAFEHYLSSDVIDKIMADPDKLRLGGEIKLLTATFSDVKNFSGFSEKLSPNNLVELLNEYLTEMTNIILAKDGTLDKYIGDAIVSFYGAPLEFEDNAVRACRATLLCHKRLLALQGKWADEGKPAIEARFGINTGNMLVGNMGSSQRFDYTIMGDEVNLASRLEGINKQYGTNIIASEASVLAASQRFERQDGDKDYRGRDHHRYADREIGFEWRELDVIRVVGRKTPVKIFELLEFKGDLSKEKSEWLLSYNEAYGLYAARKFGLARDAFKETAKLEPKDNASLKMADRCEGFVKNPPAEDWDGVYTHTTK